MSKKKFVPAYEDKQFMNSAACRGIRLELEHLKTDLTLAVHNIDSTIAIFGSARLPSPELAAASMASAKRRKGNADDKKQAITLAEQQVELSKYYQEARKFAQLVTDYSMGHTQGGYKFVVMTGGGGGIMEAANRGAKEHKGRSIGLNIKLPFEQVPNPYIDDDLYFNFHYFSIRKIHFLVRTKAVAAFPGGFGTMDELFEVLTLVQTGLIPKMPIILFGTKFWKKLINWKYFQELGFILPDDLKLFHFCDSAEEGFEIIKKFYGLK